jgi:hypothetical protein
LSSSPDDRDGGLYYGSSSSPFADDGISSSLENLSVPSSSRPSTARELIRPSSACSRSSYLQQQHQQYSTASLGRPDSDCSASTISAGGTSSSASNPNIQRQNQQQQQHHHSHGKISEATTSKVRSSLLARMKRNQDQCGVVDDDHEAGKKQEAKTKKLEENQDDEDEFFV